MGSGFSNNKRGATGGVVRSSGKKRKPLRNGTARTVSRYVAIDPADLSQRTPAASGRCAGLGAGQEAVNAGMPAQQALKTQEDFRLSAL